jgi:hypothetical protein
VLQQDPNYWNALLLKGIRLCEEEDFKNAIPVLRKVLKDTNAAEGYQTARYQLSLALSKTQGGNAEAEELLRKNAEVHQVERQIEDCVQLSENPELVIPALRALFKLGREGRHLAALLERHPTVADPSNREVHQLLAEYYETCADWDLARRHRELAARKP